MFLYLLIVQSLPLFSVLLKHYIDCLLPSCLLLHLLLKLISEIFKVETLPFDIRVIYKINVRDQMGLGLEDLLLLSIQIRN